MTIEERTNLKFLVRLGKKPTEALKLLQDVYGDDAMSRARVFEWHRRFNPLSASVFLQKFPKKCAFRKIAISQNLHKLEEKCKHESRRKINVVSKYPALFVKFCN